MNRLPDDITRPPFPYFGGKSAVAHLVWRALGDDIDNYIEPFFGSGAVLFLGPNVRGLETVNDADGFVSNFWRALQRDPDAVAAHADWPVNEVDLHARHAWLVGRREDLTERLVGDAEYCDARIAGWWCWGLCCWIGGGWCSGVGPWASVGGELQRTDSGVGVNRRRPHLSGAGQGVNRPRHGQTVAERRESLTAYLRSIADRLRRVRVCCGDWSRVVASPTTTTKHGITGVFLDPPYSTEAGRDMDIYAVDCGSVAHSAREWAIEAGRDPRMRIVLAGYEGEHNMTDDWRSRKWKANGGYGNRGDGRGRENATREMLWFSPHCIEEATLWTS